MTNNDRFPGNDIHHTVLIAKGVQIGTGNKIGPYCIIGFAAEWKGSESEGRVFIGNNNTITGLVTIDSGGGDGAVINTTIFDNCWLLKHSHIGHNAILESGVTISCGAKIGGHAIIGSGANIGLNAAIHQQQRIAEGCMIGMGAVVTKKLITEPFKTYAGNPAKLIGENSKHPEYTINQKESL